MDNNFKRNLIFSFVIIFGSIGVAAFLLNMISNQIAVDAKNIIADRALVDQQTGALALDAGTADLVLTMNMGTNPALGSVFTLINRPGSQAAITGFFTSLPNGSTVTVNNFFTSTMISFKIF